MQELLATLLQAIIAVAVPVLTAFGVRFLNERTAHAKEAATSEIAERYIAEAGNVAATAVALISQTFVEDLKKSESFDGAKQKEAFAKAVAAARGLLTAEAARFLDQAYGDATKYLAAKIEAEVKLQK